MLGSSATTEKDPCVQNASNMAQESMCERKVIEYEGIVEQTLVLKNKDVLSNPLSLCYCFNINAPECKVAVGLPPLQQQEERKREKDGHAVVRSLFYAGLFFILHLSAAEQALKLICIGHR